MHTTSESVLTLCPVLSYNTMSRRERIERGINRVGDASHHSYLSSERGLRERMFNRECVEVLALELLAQISAWTVGNHRVWNPVIKQLIYNISVNLLWLIWQLSVVYREQCNKFFLFNNKSYQIFARTFEKTDNHIQKKHSVSNSVNLLYYAILPLTLTFPHVCTLSPSDSDTTCQVE